jgi:sarcosine oxidase subunit alpha
MVRVDGVPNVRGCQTPARDGLTVESQTGIPNAEHDVAGIVDRVFERFDHERMFVRPAPVRAVYEYVARRMAGFGTQPTGQIPVSEGQTLTPDVLVSSATPAGLAAARELADAGEDVLVLDDPMRPTLLTVERDPITVDGYEADTGPELADTLRSELAAHRRKGAAIGIYDDRTLAMAREPDGWAVHAIEPDHTVIAAGAREPTALLEGNDVPGVFGARAARVLLDAWDTPPGDPVVVLDPDRQGTAFAKRAREHGLTVHTVDDPTRVEGHKRVERVHGETGTVEAEAAIVDPGLEPAPELVSQAGATFTWQRALGGRVPEHDPTGRVDDVTYVAGACAGVRTAEAALVQGQAAGQALAGRDPGDVGKRIEQAGLTDAELTALAEVWSR